MVGSTSLGITTVSLDRRNGDRIPKTATVNRLHRSRRRHQGSDFGIRETGRELRSERRAKLEMNAGGTVRHGNIPA